MKSSCTFSYFTLAIVTILGCAAQSDAPIERAQTITFENPRSASASTVDGQNIFLGAAQAGCESAALTLMNSKDGVRELALPKSLIDYIPELDNPLCNSSIQFLSVLANNNNPVVVTAQEPNSIYCLLDYSPGRSSLVTCKEVKNSQQKPCDRISALTTGHYTYTFAGVETDNSADASKREHGLAIVKLSTRTMENKAIQYYLEQLDPEKITVLPPEPKEEKEEKRDFTKRTPIPEKKAELPTIIRSLPISCDSSFLYVNHPLSSFEKITDLHWHEGLNVLYVAGHIKTGSSQNSGGFALACCRTNKQGQFIMTPIAEQSVLADYAENQIVGILKPDTQVSINKVRSMTTTTGLNYLIVQGGTGAPEETKKNIYALPLYSRPDDPENTGQLARIHASVYTRQLKREFHYVEPRTFAVRASQPEDIYTHDDLPAIVGGGQLPAPVTHISVIDDTVFAATSIGAEGLAGIFVSQALFDAMGAVKAWTPWQRITTSDESCLGFSATRPQGSLLWLTGADEKSATKLRRSDWQNKKEGQEKGLSALVSDIFKDEHGINNLIQVSHESPAIQGQSLILALGKSKIAVIQTGFTHHNELIPVDQDRYEICKGITHLPEHGSGNPRIVTLDDPELKELGSITCAQIIADRQQDARQGWLIVGGAKGVKILCHDDGSGWHMSRGGLDYDLAGLDACMKFKTLGNYAHVRKIVADNGYLYILTDNTLERIVIDQEAFAHNKLETTTVADKKSFKGCFKFFDVIISEKLALLATSNGLMRLANDCDIMSIGPSTDHHWYLMTIPEQVLPIIKLTAISSTCLETDVSRNAGGMVYVLGSYRGKNKSHMHRLVINPTDAQKSINDYTVTLLPEIVSPGEKLSLNSFHTHKNIFVTDGAFYYSYPGKENDLTSLMCGLRFNEAAPLGLEKNDEIACMIRDSASGRWMLAGTFGLLIHD